MAKDNKIKDTEEDEKTNTSGSSNKIVYGLIVFLFLLMIGAYVIGIIGLTNVPETWSWNGTIKVVGANVPNIAADAQGDDLTPTITFSNDDVNKTYNILSVHNSFAYTGGNAKPKLDVSGFQGSNSNKVLRVLNNGLKAGSNYAPLTVTGFYQPADSDISSITLNNGEYAEFLQQTSNKPTFMGISYNTPVSTNVTSTNSTYPSGCATTKPCNLGTGSGTLTQKA